MPFYSSTKDNSISFFVSVKCNNFFFRCCEELLVGRKKQPISDQVNQNKNVEKIIEVITILFNERRKIWSAFVT